MSTEPSRGSRFLKIVTLIFLPVLVVAGLYLLRLLDDRRAMSERTMHVMARAAHHLEMVAANIDQVLQTHARQLASSSGDERCRLARTPPHPHLTVTDRLPLACDAITAVTGYRFDVKGSTLVVVFEGKAPPRNDNDNDNEHENASDKKAAPQELFGYQVELDQVLDGFLDYQHSLDRMLVIGKGGQVIATPGHHDAIQPFVNIRGLLPPAPAEDRKLDDIENHIEYELDMLLRVASVRNVTIAGQGHELYSHPVRIATAADEPLVVALCGLRAVSRSGREAVALSPFWAITLAFLVIFALIAMPALKVLFISRKERIRFMDVLLLGFSALAILMLLTLITLSVLSYDRLRLQSADSLDSLAGQVQARMRDELQALYNQLHTYDRGLCELLDQADSQACVRGCAMDPPATTCATPDLLASAPPAPRCTADTGGARLDWPPPEYPYFEQISWIKPDGWQLAKTTIKQRTTAAIDVADREYFQAVRQRRAWAQPWQQPGQAFHAEAIRSHTDGQLYGVVSLPSCACWNPDEHTLVRSDPGDGAYPCPPWHTVVASMTFRPMFADHPVLPPGVGFAVVDEHGRVQFHSDRRHTVGEAFLGDVASRATLQAALYARTAQHINTAYHGRSHQMFIQPVRDLPWFVIVFSDDDALRTASIEALFHALILAFPYLLALVLVFSAGMFLVRQTRLYLRLWRWSAHSERRICKHLTWLFAAIVVGFALLIRVLPHAGGVTLDRCVAACWLIPLATLLAAALRIAIDGAPWLDRLGRLAGRAGERDPGHPALPWHFTSVALLWVILAILPAYGFYRVALEDQMRSLVKYENLHAADELDKRSRRIAELVGGGAAHGQDQRMVAGRLDWDRGDVYWLEMFVPEGVAGAPKKRASAAAGMDLDGAAALDSSTLWSDLARYKPNYSEGSLLGMRFVYPGASADGNDRWHRAGDGAIVFRRENAYLPDSEPIVLVSRLPLASPAVGGSAPGSQLGAVLGWLAVALVLAFAVWYGARRVLFHGLDQRLEQLDERDVERLLAGRTPRPVLVMIASPEHLDHMRGELAEHTRIDLAEVNSKWGRVKALRDLGHARGVVLVTGLETGVAVRDSRLAMLGFLEELLAHRKQGVVLVTSLALFPALFGDSDEPAASDVADGAGQRPDGEEKRRWSRLLASFQVTSWPVWLGTGAAGADRASELPRWLADELDADRNLGVVLGDDEVARLRGCGNSDGLARVVDAAEGYYWALWMARSEDEKLVLVQLAEEGFVNPKQVRTVRRLARLGLVRRDPLLRLMNRSFTRFIQRVHEPDVIALLERSAGGVGWSRVRVPFLALLALAMGFLAVTQQDMLSTYMGVLSAVTVALPGLLKIMGVMLRGRGGALE